MCQLKNNPTNFEAKRRVRSLDPGMFGFIVRQDRLGISHHIFSDTHQILFRIYRRRCLGVLHKITNTWNSLKVRKEFPVLTHVCRCVNCAWFYRDISALNCCIWDRNVCKWCLMLCLTYNPSVQARSVPASTKQFIACRTRMSPGTHLLCHPLLSLMACFSFYFSAQMLLSWHCLCSFSLS